MVLVFKTNSSNNDEVKIRAALAIYSEILKVDFDFEDCDNILRIESTKDISASVIKTLKMSNIYSEEL